MSEDMTAKQNETVNDAPEDVQSQNDEQQEEQSEDQNDKDIRKKDLIAEIDELKIQLAEQKDKHLRLFAEFDNFKKRTAREKLEILQTAGKDVIIDLLPVMDDLDRAMKSMEDSQDVEAVKSGMELISHKLKSTLERKGLKPMEAKGETFDAEKHEAVTEIPAPTDELKGKVVDEVERGYVLNDKIIRYAKVVVGK